MIALFNSPLTDARYGANALGQQSISGSGYALTKIPCFARNFRYTRNVIRNREQEA